MDKTSLVVQWLKLCAEGTGWLPGQGTKILYTAWCGKKKKKRKKKRKILNNQQTVFLSPKGKQYLAVNWKDTFNNLTYQHIKM